MEEINILDLPVDFQVYVETEEPSVEVSNHNDDINIVEVVDEPDVDNNTSYNSVDFEFVGGQSQMNFEEVEDYVENEQYDTNDTNEGDVVENKKRRKTN